MVQSWMNNDGLYRKFGPDASGPTIAGEYRTNGMLRVVQARIDMTALTETESTISDQVFIPAGVRIAEIKITANTAAATGVAIDLGLIKTDRTTEIDYDGLLAAFPIANMNVAGETNTIVDNTTYDGALVGTTTAFTGYITCSRTTATAFTAGDLMVEIKYYVI